MGVPRRGARAWLGLLLAGGCGRGDLPAPVEHTFTIAVLADPHLTAPSERDVRLAAAVDWIEEQREDRKIELVVVVGDIGWEGGLESARDILDSLSISYVPILGDNEVAYGDEERFDEVFGPVYDELASRYPSFERGPVEVWDPNRERTVWLQNLAFEHQGVQILGLDWVSRAESGILTELAELHDFDDGTIAWFESQLDGLRSQEHEHASEDTLLFSHHPMHIPSFDLEEMARITGATGPLGDRVAASFGGHYHIDATDRVEEGGYDVFVTDATWDDENTVRLVEVHGNGTAFELVQELVDVPW